MNKEYKIGEWCLEKQGKYVTVFHWCVFSYIARYVFVDPDSGWKCLECGKESPKVLKLFARMLEMGR